MGQHGGRAEPADEIARVRQRECSADDAAQGALRTAALDGQDLQQLELLAEIAQDAFLHPAIGADKRDLGVGRPGPHGLGDSDQREDVAARTPTGEQEAQRHAVPSSAAVTTVTDASGESTERGDHFGLRRDIGPLAGDVEKNADGRGVHEERGAARS